MPAVIGVVNVRLFGVSGDATQLIRGNEARVVKLFIRREESIGEISKKLKELDIIIAGSHLTYNRSLFTRLPKLKAVIRWGVGYDNVIVKDATEEGIIVSRLPAHVLKESVAEQTVALILAVLKKVPQAFNYAKSGEWFNTFPEQPEFLIGECLEDKVIGFIGLGEIGFKVLELLKPFKPKRVLVYDPYVSRDFIRLAGAIAASNLDEILTYSDIITIHAPLTAETKKMLNREKFERMKRGVYLINTARGGIVDSKALLWALENGIIKAAALDVFDPEPIPPDHPIFKFDNVLITPHLAFGTEESCRLMDEYSLAEALRILRGEKPLWALNPEVLESEKLRAKIRLD